MKPIEFIKNKIFIASSGLAILIIAIVLMVVLSHEDDTFARCEKSTFQTGVTTVGDIQATQSIDIHIPDAMFNREIRIWQLKIIDMVAEGTVVKKGDYVATLDPGDVENELKRADDQLTEYLNSLESAKLDTSLTLSASRAEIRNASDQLTDKEIKVEQSKFESKAYQRQAQIDLERALRDLEKQKRNYQKQKRKLEVNLSRIENDIKQAQYRKNLLLQLKEDLKVKAPSDGMLIYAKSWDGSKIKVNTDVGRWAPVIASLPDLTQLVSEAFVQEVDIKHISLGQRVQITIDAFPEEKFTGKVVKIANIGQTIPGKDMNGLKVTIAFDPYHAKLLPGMTTSNFILTGEWKDAIIVPRPAVFGNDSCYYVYMNKGFNQVKQQILIEGENETHFRVKRGLDEGDKVLLLESEEMKQMEIQHLD